MYFKAAIVAADRFAQDRLVGLEVREGQDAAPLCNLARDRLADRTGVHRFGTFLRDSLHGLCKIFLDETPSDFDGPSPVKLNACSLWKSFGVQVFAHS